MKILVTACGSIGAINYVNALRKSVMKKTEIVGTDYYPLNAAMCDVDRFYQTVQHHRPEYVDKIRKLHVCENFDFIHPSIEAEARVVAIQFPDYPTYLPKIETSAICQNKYETCTLLSEHGLAKIPFKYLENKTHLEAMFSLLGSPLWIRLSVGAGGRGSLLCKTPEIMKQWVDLNVALGKGKEKDFIIQQYLSGPDYAFDSLWFHGKLVTSFTRKRLSYLFPHLSMSGITGTPTASEIVCDQKLNLTAVDSILTIDSQPHGLFCVDMKLDADGKPYVTEVNTKAHTTMFLYSLIPESFNLAWYYTVLGIKGELMDDLEQFDLYPEGLQLLRTIDAGVFTLLDGEKRRIW